MMSSQYVAPNDRVSAPAIEPLHSEVIHYQDIVEGRGRIVIHAYEGMAPGQEVVWSVKGYGDLFGFIEVVEVKKYSAKLNALAFTTSQVIASYIVTLDREVIFESDSVTYRVEGFPVK